MKTMKILSILTIIFSFSQCSSNKFVENPPFKVEKAVYNNWSGGQPGVSGTMVEIHLLNAFEIEFDSLYFQQKETKLEVSKKENKTILIGHFSTSTREPRNLVLDVDTTKELKNTPPNVTKPKFDLKENEAVLSYKKGNEMYYFKVENIKQLTPKFFPSANKK